MADQQWVQQSPLQIGRSTVSGPSEDPHFGTFVKLLTTDFTDLTDAPASGPLRPLVSPFFLAVYSMSAVQQALTAHPQKMERPGAEPGFSRSCDRVANAAMWQVVQSQIADALSPRYLWTPGSMLPAPFRFDFHIDDVSPV